MQIRMRGRGLAILVVATALSLPAAASAESPAKEFGVGAGTVLANMVYMPAKVFYAVGGGLVASIAYAFSGGDEEVARPIVDSSLRGDYVITPAHVRGEDELEFIGRTPAQRHARDVASGGTNSGAAGSWGGAPLEEENLDDGF